MPKRVRDHRGWMLRELQNPRIAVGYLSAALSESTVLFLTALRDVAEARKMAKVAQGAGVRREALYRTLSREGNPRLSTLDSVLRVLGLRLSVELPSVGTFRAQGFEIAATETTAVNYSHREMLGTVSGDADPSLASIPPADIVEYQELRSTAHV